MLNQTYLPDPVATSQYLARWAEHLARRGDDVTVIASRRAYHDMRTRHPARETRAGVEIVRVAGGGGRSRLGRVLGFAGFLLGVAVRGLSGPRPDVIVALTSPPLLPVIGAALAWMRGARLLVWAMDLHPDAAIAAGLLREDSMAAAVARRLMRWALRRAAQVVTLDEHMRRRLLAQGVAPARVTVVPLWIPGDIAFDPIGRAQVRRARGWEGKFVVMCAGNHGACHSMETLLAAAVALRDDPAIHFCWVGGGSQWPALHEHAARNVSFIGYVPREKLAAMLSAADLQVVVMGGAFTGLLHPCKVYNILATRRPFLYLGPEKGPVPDVIRAARLGNGAASFRHDDLRGVMREIRRRAISATNVPPVTADLTFWQEVRAIEKLTSALQHGRRFLSSVHASPCFLSHGPDCDGVVVSAPVGRGLGHGS